MTLTVVILTRDEARHIARCIASVREIATRILVVDSGSTDLTREIAEGLGADVLVNPWINYATQFNWALDHGNIVSDWTMRLDADEIVLPELATALKQLLVPEQTATGITVRRQIHFMGRWIRFGDIYPVRMLKVWRTGKGRCEQRWMDEHMIVEGEVRDLDEDIADINLNNIGWWTDKHNKYATREAIDHLQTLASGTNGHDRGFRHGTQAGLKRWLKNNVYARLPLGLRPLLYFLYRYFLRLGFLDGWQGLAFHVLQGFWYRFLVDVKIAEIRGLMQARNHDLSTVIETEYGHKL